MTAPLDDPAAAMSAQALFAAEGLPFPPVPDPLGDSLQKQRNGWYATRPVASTPYDLEHFVAEVESAPGVVDYALVGFDGYGTNTWAVHYYLVARSLGLFIQMPWGGAYTDAESARADIAGMFDWAAMLQSRLQQAEALHTIPDGMRLVVCASRLGHAGWRWIRAGQDADALPWNPAAGMLGSILAELDDIVSGRRRLSAAA